MKYGWLGLFAVVCGVGVLAMPARARACSCASEFAVFPESGSQGLPLNVRVWQSTSSRVLEYEPATIRLYDVGNDQLIDTERQLLENPYDLVIVNYRPVQELTPRSVYDVRGYDEDGEFFVLSTFSVGDTRDDDPPPPPTLVEHYVWAEPAEEGSSCGVYDAFGTSFELEYDGLVVVDRDGQSTITDQPQGLVSAMSMVFPLLGLSNGACVHNWQEADEGTKARVRFGQFDLAGNFSGWDAGMDIEIPLLPEPEPDPEAAMVAGEDCACRHDRSPGPMGRLAGLVGLFLLGRRRRRGGRPMGCGRGGCG